MISKIETNLEFVSRVERNFSHFLVPCSDTHDITQNDFCEFQQSCFRGITYHNSLYAQKKEFIAHLLPHFHQGRLRDAVTCCMLEQQWICIAVFKPSCKIIAVKNLEHIFCTCCRDIPLAFDSAKAKALWLLSGPWGGFVTHVRVAAGVLAELAGAQKARTSRKALMEYVAEIRDLFLSPELTAFSSHKLSHKLRQADLFCFAVLN